MFRREKKNLRKLTTKRFEVNETVSDAMESTRTVLMDAFRVQDIDMNSHNFACEVIRGDFEIYISFKSKRSSPNYTTITMQFVKEDEKKEKLNAFLLFAEEFVIFYEFMQVTLLRQKKR